MSDELTASEAIARHNHKLGKVQNGWKLTDLKAEHKPNNLWCVTGVFSLENQCTMDLNQYVHGKHEEIHEQILELYKSALWS